MKKTFILAAIATLSVLSAGASAETYDGVHAATSTKSRAEVNAEAVRTAAAPDQTVELGSRGPLPFNAVADIAAVRAQAVATANAPDQNINPSSRVNSRVVSTFSKAGSTVASK